jgi:phosphate transport system substrate-binding protein
MFSMLKMSLCAAAAALALWSSPALAEDVKITGSGASFPAPIYKKWVEEFNKTHPGIVVDYQSSGSGAGIKAITDRTASFGASDAPLTGDQEKATPAKLLHLPMVAGPEVLIYNVPELPKLKIDSAVLSGIFMNQIKRWNDPRIAAINPGIALPNKPIVVVHRSDGSGTTFIFTDYLSKASPDWKAKVGKGTTVQWPVGLGGAGNPGVAQLVKQTEGAIGYVESAYATSQNPPLRYASMVNKDGREVTASIAGVEAASAALLKEIPDDFKVSITDAPGAESYPICGFTFVLMYEDLSYLKDKAKAQALVDYIQWCVSDAGQGMVGQLGYAKLPPAAQAKVIERIKTIKFDGTVLAK